MQPIRPIVSLRLAMLLVLVPVLVSGPSTAWAQQAGQAKRRTGSPPELIEDEMVTRQAICRRAVEAAGSRWQARRSLLAKGGRHRSLCLVLDENPAGGNVRVPRLGR